MNSYELKRSFSDLLARSTTLQSRQEMGEVCALQVATGSVSRDLAKR